MYLNRSVKWAAHVIHAPSSAGSTLKRHSARLKYLAFPSELVNCTVAPSIGSALLTRYDILPRFVSVPRLSTMPNVENSNPIPGGVSGF